MNATEAGENDRSRGYWEPRGKDPSFPPTDPKAPADNSAKPRHFLPGVIKQLFRAALNHLTGQAPAPQPTKRRRRGGTQGGFRLAVKQILRRVQRSIYHPAYFLCEPPDEMDEAQRLHLWHQNNQEGEYSHENEAFNYGPQDHLSLHL